VDAAAFDVIELAGLPFDEILARLPAPVFRPYVAPLFCPPTPTWAGHAAHAGPYALESQHAHVLALWLASKDQEFSPSASDGQPTPTTDIVDDDDE
jgi:hypothetical protein